MLLIINNTLKVHFIDKNVRVYIVYHVNGIFYNLTICLTMETISHENLNDISQKYFGIDIAEQRDYNAKQLYNLLLRKKPQILQQLQSTNKAENLLTDWKTLDDVFKYDHTFIKEMINAIDNRTMEDRKDIYQSVNVEKFNEIQKHKNERIQEVTSNTINKQNTEILNTISMESGDNTNTPSTKQELMKWDTNFTSLLDAIQTHAAIWRASEDMYEKILQTFYSWDLAESPETIRNITKSFVKSMIDYTAKQRSGTKVYNETNFAHIALDALQWKERFNCSIQNNKERISKVKKIIDHMSYDKRTTIVEKYDTVSWFNYALESRYTDDIIYLLQHPEQEELYQFLNTACSQLDLVGKKKRRMWTLWQIGIQHITKLIDSNKPENIIKLLDLAIEEISWSRVDHYRRERRGAIREFLQFDVEEINSILEVLPVYTLIDSIAEIQELNIDIVDFSKLTTTQQHKIITICTKYRWFLGLIMHENESVINNIDSLEKLIELWEFSKKKRDSMGSFKSDVEQRKIEFWFYKHKEDYGFFNLTKHIWLDMLCELLEIHWVKRTYNKLLKAYIKKYKKNKKYVGGIRGLWYTRENYEESLQDVAKEIIDTREQKSILQQVEERFDKDGFVS